MTTTVPERKPRGRPQGRARTHKRMVAFVPEVYERVERIAAYEERSVTAQINKILREFVETYEVEHVVEPSKDSG